MIKYLRLTRTGRQRLSNYLLLRLYYYKPTEYSKGNHRILVTERWASMLKCTSRCKHFWSEL